MAGSQPKKTVRQKSESDIRPVPRAVREIWHEQRQADINIPTNYRRKWADQEIEKVIEATPEQYPSYWELAQELDRSVGALHRVKQIVIELLERRTYALQMANSGLAKRHDYAHVYRILSEKGYMVLPESERQGYARHLPKPNSGWRGDHTQSVLARRRSG